VLQYGTDVSGIIPAIINAFNPFARELTGGRFSPGHRVEIFLLCLFSASYVWTKTKSHLKTVLVWLTHMVGFLGLLGFWPVVMLDPIYRLFPVFNRLVPADLVSSPLIDKIILTPSLIYTSDQKAGFSLMFGIVFFLFLWFKIYAGKNFRDFIKGLDWSRGLNYAGLTLAGIIFGSWRMKNVLSFAFHNPLDYYAAVLLPLAVFFLFQHTRVISGVIEGQYHKSVIWASKKEQLVISAGFLFLALYSAFNISYWCFLYMLVFLLVFYLVMLPPLKIIKFPVISDVLLSLTSMFAFFTGFGLLADREAVHLLPAPLWRAGFFAFFLACSLRYVDKIGRKPVALMVFVSFMVVPFFSYITPMYVPAGLLGLLGVFAVLKFNKRLIPAMSALFISFYGVILFSIKRYVDIAL
ncbi:MAG: hypothetical protein GX817_06855, partial [Elusimicrobia bacterium]|nr:hypothetical protein [Elusimicrobiota bacterium]